MAWWRARKRKAMGAVRGTLSGIVNRRTGLLPAELSVLDGGVVLAGEDGPEGDAPREYTWADIAHVWFADDIDGERPGDGTVTIEWVCRLRLQFDDGKVWSTRTVEPPVEMPEQEFLSGDFRELPAEAGPLRRHICDRVAEVQLVEVRAALAEGREVRFDALTATAEGLRHRDTEVSWEDIRVLRYSFVYAASWEGELGAWLYLEFRDSEQFLGFGFSRIPAYDVQDLEVLVRLATERRAA